MKKIMKREIKFRGFNENNWCYGYYFKHPTSDTHSIFLSDGNGSRVVEKYSIMQFTGLKDKNGVDIYEGDICRILYTDWPSNTDTNISLEDYLVSISHVGPVVYQAPSFGILLDDRYGDKTLASFNYGPHGRIQVIGNIYQNSELLNN